MTNKKLKFCFLKICCFVLFLDMCYSLLETIFSLMQVDYIVLCN